MHKDWSQLNPALVARMRGRLGDAFDTFAQMSSEIGLLKNNFLKLSQLADADLEFASSMCVSAIVSAANHYGSQGQIALAKQLVQCGLVLEPRHVPAWLCLRAISQVEENGRAEEFCNDKINTIKSEILAKPDSQRSAMEKGIVEAISNNEL